MKRRNRVWAGGAAALGAGLLVAGPLTAAAQGDDDWVSNALSGLVSDGTLTQQQADAVDQALDAARPAGQHGPREGRFGPLRARIGLDEAAKAIGIEPAALREELRDGKTIAEVAADNGVDVQTVIDAMVAAAKTRLDAAVADGRLEAGTEATRLTEVTDRITEFVNEGFPTRVERRHRRGDEEATSPTDEPDTTTPDATTPPTTTD